MLYKNLLIALIISRQICAMDRYVQQNTRSVVFYESVIPGYLSGQVPCLRLLAAQKIHEMNKKKQLMPTQIISHECAICNEVLYENFLHMRKDIAQPYALSLFGAPVPRRGRGNVAQKRRALEMMIKANGY